MVALFLRLLNTLLQDEVLDSNTGALHVTILEELEGSLKPPTRLRFNCIVQIHNASPYELALAGLARCVSHVNTFDSRFCTDMLV